VTFWHLLVHIIGMDHAGTKWNLFWSGFGGSPVMWLATPLVYARAQNCHELWCFRLGRHQYPDGTKFCRKHHLLRQVKP
jgi:hypothetical protein